jgi:hypothetical protein
MFWRLSPLSASRESVFRTVTRDVCLQAYARHLNGGLCVFYDGGR